LKEGEGISTAKALIQKALEKKKAREQKRLESRSKSKKPAVRMPLLKPTDKLRCRNQRCQYLHDFKHPVDWEYKYSKAFCPFCGYIGEPVTEGQHLNVNWEDPITQDIIYKWVEEKWVRRPEVIIDPKAYINQFKHINKARCEELKPKYIWTARTESEEQIEQTIIRINEVDMAEAGFPEPTNCNPPTCSFKGRCCFVGFDEGGAKEGRCRLGMMLCGIKPTSRRMQTKNKEEQIKHRQKVSARLRLREKLKGIRGD